MKNIYYTCKGNVCSDCDVKHRTIGAAVRCCSRHAASIVRHNGRGAYSDRSVVRVDGKSLTEWERDEVEHEENVISGWD